MGTDEKSMKVPGGPLHGNPSFDTGPSRPFRHPFQNKDSHGAKGTMKTGPNNVAGDIGHKAKGSSGGGTKADEKGEDSGGKA